MECSTVSRMVLAIIRKDKCMYKTKVNCMVYQAKRHCGTIVGSWSWRSISTPGPEIFIHSQQGDLHSVVQQDNNKTVNLPTNGGNALARLHNKEATDPLIIYDKDGIFAVNKPRYVSMFGNVSPNQTGDSSSLQQLVRAREEKDGKSFFGVGLSLKSFYTGIAVFCRSQDSKTKLEKLVSRAATKKAPFISYLAVTVGVPKCPHGQNLESYISRDYLHEQEMSIVSDKPMHSARKAGSAMSVNYRICPLVVSQSTGAALVEITLNKDKWQAAEVLLSHHLSPVLGDAIYSSRTYSVMGVPFPATPHMARPAPQRLPAVMQEALSTDPNYSPALPGKPSPLFLHRHQVTLNDFHHQDSPSLTLRAAPHSDFLSILKSLGLYEEDLWRQDDNR